MKMTYFQISVRDIYTFILVFSVVLAGQNPLKIERKWTPKHT